MLPSVRLQFVSPIVYLDILCILIYSRFDIQDTDPVAARSLTMLAERLRMPRVLKRKPKICPSPNWVQYMQIGYPQIPMVLHHHFSHSMATMEIRVFFRKQFQFSLALSSTDYNEWIHWLIIYNRIILPCLLPHAPGQHVINPTPLCLNASPSEIMVYNMSLK